MQSAEADRGVRPRLKYQMVCVWPRSEAAVGRAATPAQYPVVAALLAPLAHPGAARSPPIRGSNAALAAVAGTLHAVSLGVSGQGRSERKGQQARYGRNPTC